MAGETNIGGIVGFLRLEADQFHREIGRALTEIDLLDGRRVDIDIDVDRTGAASIAATERQVDRLDGSVKRLGTTSRSSRAGVGALATAIITLGPALVPLAAGAVGLAAAFGGMGAAGIAALVGIKNEMEAGTDVGLTYKDTLDGAKESLGQLATTAAKNVLGPVQDSVAVLNDAMPVLNTQIGEFATLSGKAGAAVVSGLVGGFQTLNPLMLDAGVYILDLMERFERASTGSGMADFVTYVRSVFPQVVEDVEAIVAAVGHLVAAFAPLGLGTLSALRLLSDLISAIPTDVLATIAQLAGGVFLGFKAWQALSTPINGLITMLGGVEAMSTRAAVAVRGLQLAAGIIGIALAGLSMIIGANAEANRANEQAVNDYADALRQSNGVIDESIRQMTAKKLADEGVLEAGRQLGIKLSDITDAALGNANAMAIVNATINAHGDALKQTANSGRYAAQVDSELGNAADKVRDAIGQTNGQLDAGIQKQKDLADATAVNAGATSNLSVATQTLANTYGASVATYQAVMTGQQGLADKAAQATLKMQLENDAAGLLKQTLDGLNGEALTAAQAQNAFDSSLANMGTHITKTGKKVEFTTTSINNMSAASVALRGQLNGQVENLQRVVEANGGLQDSTGKAREQMVKMRQQIIDNAVAHGVDRDAVTAYIDKLLKIPKKVPPTKLDIDNAAALRKKKALQDAINALKGRTVTVNIRQVYTTIGSPARAIHNEQTLYSNGINPNLAGGGIFSGGVRKMAAGDLTGRPSMIMRSTKPILWNEAPGGEAYISLAPQQRARSLAIHEQVGKMLGANRQQPQPVTEMTNNFHLSDGATAKDIVSELDWKARRR